MMTPRENFLELLKRDGRPDRVLDQYEAINLVLYDPINAYLRGNRKRGVTSRDRWGTVIDWPEDAPGAMPHVTDDTKVIKDITHWRDYVHVPDIHANVQTGWEECRAKAHAADPNHEKLLTGFMGTGIFEQCHFLIPFADVLAYLYEYPDEMHDLIETITEYRLQYVKELIDGLHPDAILSHDDWGAKDALFFRPEMWREFFKEPYERFYGYIRSRGVIAIHHADSYLVPILDDMAEIGIQVWQGALPENNIPEVLGHMDGRLVLMGGIGAAIDRADAGEEEIRAYVRNVLNQDCPYGHFIPCITYGVPGTVFPQVDPVIDDEIRKYNEEKHLPRFYHAPVRRQKSPSAGRSKGENALTGKGSSASGSPLSGISASGGTVNSVSPAPQGSSASAIAAAAGAGSDAVGTGTAETGAAGSDSAAASSKGSLTDLISQALQKGRKAKVVSLTKKALDAGVNPEDILNDGLIAGMNAVGEAFSANKVFVPEMIMAARCMVASTDILKPHLVQDAGAEYKGRVILGTVKGDLHDIGKNLVKIMMEGSGLEVIDLGTDISAEIFVQTAIDKDADMIACSALLTTSMLEMKRVVEEADRRGIRDHVKILVGGAPVTQKYCDEIGADGYTDDAAAAARAAVKMLG
jgi:corrinoid protein of di/trimethylamine methyltransferase